MVIGLEVHAQVASKAKLFSGASTEFGGEPNSHVSLVDAAMPGMLPVINEACVAQAVRTGLGTEGARSTSSRCSTARTTSIPTCRRAIRSRQYKQPIVGAGEVEVDVDGETMKVGIERLHLEQDAGKSIHDQHPEYTFVDLNRSGVALMEIVSKPDLRSAKQAQAYVLQAPHHPALSRHLRRRHGEGQPARRRQRLRAQARRQSSAPAARSRTSTRSASSARPSRPRRAARSTSSRTAARSSRRRGCSTRPRA